MLEPPKLGNPRAADHLDGKGWVSLVEVANDEQGSGPLVDTARELVFRRASEDLRFFLESFWQVATVKKGYAPMQLRPYQVGQVRLFEEACKVDRAREVALKARQIGFTTISTAGAFWSAYFHPHHSWLFASQGQTEAQDTLTTKVKEPFDLLPLWLKAKGPTRTDKSLERFSFDNGSQLISIASTSGAGRSKSVFGVLLDEYAFVEDANGLMSAIDPLCYGPMFVFSTANGIGNPFHDLWIESQTHDSGWNELSRLHRPTEEYCGAFQPWSAVPERDQKWYDREKRKARGREHLFFQEFPSTPEEAFIKSGRTALPIELLKDEQCWCDPAFRVDLDLLRWGENEIPAEAVIDDPTDERANELWPWQLPEVERDERNGHVVRQPSYVIGTDIAEGLEGGDRTAISILNANTMEIVASYLGHYPVEYLDRLLAWLGYFYFSALMVPERNNLGVGVIGNLQLGGYSRIIRMDQAASRSPGRLSTRYGWITTTQSKPRLVYDFVRSLRDGKILLHDKRFYREALTFLIDDRGGFNASAGNHDDAIIATMLTIQGEKSLLDYPLVWRDPSVLGVTYGQLQAVGTTSPSGRRGIGASNPVQAGSRTSFYMAP